MDPREEDRFEEMTSEESVAIAIPDAIQNRVRQRLHASPGDPRDNPRFTICRVPARRRKRNKACYEPQMVPIGPYHRGRKHLRPMEDHKWRYLRHFLSRDSQNSWEVYFMKMKAIEPHIRRHYAERVNLSSDKFAEMLLLDGCFILEFLHKLRENEDDIFSTAILRRIIWLDLFLLENQLPFSVLERLFKLLHDSMARRAGSPRDLVSGSDGESSKTLVQLVSTVLLNLPGHRPINASDGEFFDHLVHLSHCSFVSAPQPSPSSDERPGVHTRRRRSERPSKLIFLLFSYLSCFWQRSTTKSSILFPSARELQESGVILKQKLDGYNFLDITFSPKDGVLVIPPLLIEHSIEYTFTNLVAFEQTKRMERKYLSSYAAFMMCLIRTPKDLAILQQCEIIQNALPNEEAAARFFNDLADFIGVDPSDNYLSELIEKVRQYCNSKWHTNRAILIRKYFSNPWSILSLVAAVILLLLTIIQTFFSAYAYFRPPHP